MIISQTPFRVSFFGGGTDYPAWYREKGGAVLTSTIDKYCYISCRPLPPFFGYKHRIVYSQIEVVTALEEIKHPAVKAVFTEMGIERGLAIHHDGDLPARSGLGSSSAFTVGLINAIRALNGEITSKKELAKQAIHIEQNIAKEAVGSQDQVATAFGGLNVINFHHNDSFDVSPVILDEKRKDEFQDHLMLFFTGFFRTASEIAQAKIDNFANREQELTAMQAMVTEAMAILQSKTAPIESIGKLLHESWSIKRKLAKGVTNSSIDQIYEAGLRAGATGGKILGAGGGGFILFFVKPELQAKVKEVLKDLIYVKFNFESAGSKIALYDPNL